MNNFRTNSFLRFWGILGVRNGNPDPAPPSPASMSKFLLGGKNTENTCFFDDFCEFYNIFLFLNSTKMITSCSIRRVGRRIHEPTNLMGELTKMSKSK